MSSFVVIYNRKTGKSDVRSFEGANAHRAAFQERLRLEEANQDGDIEIVSLVSDSIETVKRTHSRYFAFA